MDRPELQTMLKMENRSVLSIRDGRDMYILNGIANGLTPVELDKKLLTQNMEPLWKTN